VITLEIEPELVAVARSNLQKAGILNAEVRLADGSKIALAALVALLVREGFTMIDCQQQTEHLALMGARPIPRQRYLEKIDVLCRLSPPDWSTCQLDWP